MLAMRRFGILALAGVLVVVGCSKKKQEAAADSAVESTNSVAAAVTSGAGASFAPALAAAGAGDYSHPIGSGWTWNADDTQISRPVSKLGMTGTLVVKFSYTDGGGVHVSSEPYRDQLYRGKTVKLASTLSMSGSNKTLTADMSGDITFAGKDTDAGGVQVDVTQNGTGKFSNTDKKVTLSLTFTTMKFNKTAKMLGGTVSGSGDSDGKAVSFTTTWSNGVGDGTVTVEGETWTIHINPDGESYREKDGKRVVI